MKCSAAATRPIRSQNSSYSPTRSILPAALPSLPWVLLIAPGTTRSILTFNSTNRRHGRFHAPGEFAQAYVIAHEIGHHVQNLLGISEKVRSMQQGADKATANNLSVRLELQADCLAGIWAYHADRTRNIVEAGDIEAALRAASSIGDDRIQKQTQGRVVPESFTHGSSDQRGRRFKLGTETGDFAQCDTFKAGSL